ncbi:MAG: SDR family NAD(P)-dependent oxidoreductase [Lachnospiraceae bacterium]|nr:SDR family NAD(P)-dependent oxidoreductase [Lachnospiraceae bacterium]
MERKRKIAIITGATGGIGQEFTKVLAKEALDEIWVIGRNKEKLAWLKQEYGRKIIPLCADLTEKQDLLQIKSLLTGKILVAYLVNNAGIACMAHSKDYNTDEIDKTIMLNCNVPVTLINYCIPYMERGSRIINVSSAASFQPVPLINLYASTKAFLHNYSRALHMELKPAGITVTAACPGWVDTDMLPKELNGIKVKFPGITTPQKIARKAVKDAKKGKDVSICTLYVKCQHLNVKLLPHKLVMKIWMHGIRKYI